jgi:hypothetical protein
MKEALSARWYFPLLVAVVSMLALMVLVIVVSDALAGHALGTDARTAWQPHLAKVDAALARGDVAGAAMLWREAYAAALASRHWEGLVEVGDTYRRLGELGGFRPAATAKARQAYLAAFFRARQEGSLAGVLRVAEAFAELGDREVVARCIRVAEALAAQARDATGRERVRVFGEGWAGQQGSLR